MTALLEIVRLKSNDWVVSALECLIVLLMVFTNGVVATHSLLLVTFHSLPHADEHFFTGRLLGISPDEIVSILCAKEVEHVITLGLLVSQ